MRLRYSWMDLLMYPLMIVLLAPLVWHLVQIVTAFALASSE